MSIDWEALYSGNNVGARDARLEVSRLTCRECGGVQEGCTCEPDTERTTTPDRAAGSVENTEER
jgi:hypothetical protein